MLQAQEKAALRLRARDFGSGPPDDLDLEWEQLLSGYRAAHGLEEEEVAGLGEDDPRRATGCRRCRAARRGHRGGAGRARPKKRKGERPKVGRAGEDVAADESGSGGGLRLRLPARFGLGTVKAAAWSVLAEAGPAGLKVDEIARRIQRRGLRDLRTSKTPEASVAGALGRDVLFQRVDLGTYALAAVVAYEARMAARGEEVKLDEDAPPPAPGEDKVAPSRGFVQVIVDDDASGGGGGAKGAGSGDGGGGASKEAKDGKVDGQDADKVAKEEDDDEDDDDEHDDESDDESEELDASSDDDASSSDEEAGAKSSSLGGTPGKKAGAGGKAARENQASRAAGWVEALKDRDYDALTLADRAGMLGALCYLAMQAPSVRDVMERRIEEQQRLKRQLWEESKLEKRRRQIENAQRLRAAAEEAQRAVERYRHLAPSGAASAAASVADRGAKAEDVEQGAVQSPAQKSRDDVAGVDEVKEEKAEAEREAKAEAGATAPTPAVKSDQGAAPSAASCEGDVKESGSSPMDTNEGEAAEAMDTNEGETAGATRTPGAASPVKKEETTLPDRSAEDPTLAMEAHVSAAQAIAAAGARRPSARPRTARRHASARRSARSRCCGRWS
ncbi:hypothetical protein QBZ16_002845 [Prototheca wickerhamii]|uniref:HTH HARE-type domain-containing protein n=1 Tax=Prototheca wickerhamii TaxID=3111 RepID=A0AAD9MHV5_PROWI|nr:hypothetical protein QBZ16_002845 [Prototheca wickerhamii]